MIVLEEGDLRFEFTNASSGIKFDEQDKADPDFHGLSHCMKAFDFVVEFQDRYLFLEVKDPPQASAYNNNEDYSKLLKGLVTKFRYTFLYRWAEKKLNKPVTYHCLVNLDSALTLKIMTDLKRELPEVRPKNLRWKQPLVSGCAVSNVTDWNAAFPKWKITRISINS